jgi:hypothetical protein
MKKTPITAKSAPNFFQLFGRLALGIVLVALVFQPFQVSASQITSRNVALGTSQGGTSTSHNFTFTLPTSTTVKSMDFLYCTTASGGCTTPTGLTTTTAALNGAPGNLGSGGSWVVGGTPTNGRIQIDNASNTGSPSAGATVNFNTITNPTLSGNSTVFYVRITSYSDAAWTTALDTGTVASAVTNQIQVTASVNETLDFCAFQTGSTCAGGTGTTVALGSLSSSAATTGTSVMLAGTNATTGYTIQYTGATLTGPSTIAATGASGASSTTGSAQFGINVANNTSPTVGAAPSGGIGAGGTHYATANTFSYVASTLTQIAQATGSTADTTFTVSYLANIPSNQAAGSYTTTITYICTALF